MQVDKLPGMLAMVALKKLKAARRLFPLSDSEWL